MLPRTLVWIAAAAAACTGTVGTVPGSDGAVTDRDGPLPPDGAGPPPDGSTSPADSSVPPPDAGPRPPTPELAEYYAWLESVQGMRRTWIRTDYRFSDCETAARATAFFFGDEFAARVRRQGWSRIPECTGLWWRSRRAGDESAARG